MRTRVTISETPSHPKCSHRVRYPSEGGKIKQRWFTNETDALAFKKEQEEQVGFNGSDFGTITDEERNALSFWRSFKTSSPTAPELPVVLRAYSKTWKEKNASITIKAALAKFIIHQEAEGASVRHVASIRSRVGRLVTDHGEKVVAAMDSGTFSDWLNGLRGTRADKVGDKLTMTTRDNLKKTCRTFFSYCVERGWTSINPVPLAAKKRTREHRIAKRKAPAIMQPSDIEKFLHKIEEISEVILPFWLFKFFAGIRDAEAGRMDWRMVDLEKGEVNLPAEITKTGDARKVKIEPVLRDWLTPYAKKAGPVAPAATTVRCHYKKVLRHLRAPKKKGGKPQVFEFPSNAARHSFGTFHLYHFRNPGETAIQLGHKGNPAMLWEHYANPAAEELAEAFWLIKSGKEKVVSISKGRRMA